MPSAKSFAERNGYSLNDILNHTSYGKACRLHTKIFDKMARGGQSILRDRSCAEIEHLDGEMAAFDLDLELLMLAENRRRKEAKAIKLVTEAYYHRLRSRSPGIILPPLTTFQQLPAIGSLLSLANHEISNSMNKLLEMGVLRADLEKWESDARNQLAAVLGYSEWATAKTKILHPVDRLTACFQCKKCIQAGRRYKGGASLDFGRACAHECEMEVNERWMATNFVKDEKVRKNQ